MADAQSLRPWLAQLAADGRLVEIGESSIPRPGSPRGSSRIDREPVRVARVRGSELPARREPAGRAARSSPRRSASTSAASGRICSARWRRRSSRGSSAAAACQEVVEERSRPRAAADPALLRARGRAVHHRRLHRRARSRDGRAQLVDRARAAARRLARARRHRAQSPPRGRRARCARARRAPADRGDDRQPPGARWSRPASTSRAARTSCASPARCSASPWRSCAARTVPLEVPPGCEIVLEGELDLDDTVEEGPVSEFHGGYERYGRAATATFRA